jgi:ATP synthase protein I
MTRSHTMNTWDDNEDEAAARREEAAFRPLTREEAVALRARQPSLSPWRVLGVQMAVGGVAALLAVLWSVLYGAATVVVPGALMARGMTSKLSSMSPGAALSASCCGRWSKSGFGGHAVLAPKLVQPLSWPACWWAWWCA